MPADPQKSIGIARNTANRHNKRYFFEHKSSYGIITVRLCAMFERVSSSVAKLSLLIHSKNLFKRKGFIKWTLELLKSLKIHTTTDTPFICATGFDDWDDQLSVDSPIDLTEWIKQK